MEGAEVNQCQFVPHHCHVKTVLLEADVSHSGPPAREGSPNGHLSKQDTASGQTKSQHYKDWPNADGFNVHEESSTPRELQVTGSFPPWVAGSLLRTGPSESRVPRPDPSEPDYAVSHWFDGFTRIHKFEISHTISGESKVHYTARSQVDRLLEHARKSGKLEGFSFAQKRDPCDSFYKKLKTVFVSPETKLGAEDANVGVAFMPPIMPEDNAAGADRNVVRVTTDSTSTKGLDLETLEPMGVATQRKLHKDLTGPMSAAHAAFDPETGDVFNYNLAFGKKDVYRVFKTDAKTGETTILATMSGKDVKAAYIHSMFITENFLVLVIWPAFIQGLSILWNRNILDSMKFDADAKTTWCVIDRKNGRGLVQKFTSPAMFCFHSINAWEENESQGQVDLRLDLCEWPNMDVLKRFYYENMISTGPGVSRYRMGENRNLVPSIVQYRLSGVSTTSRVLSTTKTAEIIKNIPTPGDLPTINPKFATRRHRFVYSAIDRGYSSFMDGIAKTDTETGVDTIWEHPKHTPGEPIFLPNPNGQSEDDGVVLAVVFNGQTSKSYLLCLDARDFSEVARAEVDAPVAFGFHGTHIPAKG